MWCKDFLRHAHLGASWPSASAAVLICLREGMDLSAHHAESVLPYANESGGGQYSLKAAEKYGWAFLKFAILSESVFPLEVL